MQLEPTDIPEGFEVRPLDADDEHATATCGDCGLSWNDDEPTSYTPAPSARCPFEAFHDDEPDAPPALADLLAWSSNYRNSPDTDPARLFVSLIRGDSPLAGGYLEASKIGAALVEYAQRPQAVRDALEAEGYDV